MLWDADVDHMTTSRDNFGIKHSLFISWENVQVLRMDLSNAEGVGKESEGKLREKHSAVRRRVSTMGNLVHLNGMCRLT